jgi:alcohol dehydrogenase
MHVRGRATVALIVATLVCAAGTAPAALTIKAGQVPVQKYIDHLITLVSEGKVVLNDIITHKLPLMEAEMAYDIFCNKKDNCVKVVLQP